MSGEIQSNPYISQVPPCLQGYRHPCHQHPMYINFIRGDNPSIVCDNENCEQDLSEPSDSGALLTFYCPICNFDLCSDCFRLNCDTDSVCTEPYGTPPDFDDRIFNRKRFVVRVSQVELELPLSDDDQDDQLEPQNPTEHSEELEQ